MIILYSTHLNHQPKNQPTPIEKSDYLPSQPDPRTSLLASPLARAQHIDLPVSPPQGRDPPIEIPPDIFPCCINPTITTICQRNKQNPRLLTARPILSIEEGDLR